MKPVIALKLLIILPFLFCCSQANAQQNKSPWARIVRPIETQSKYHSLDVEDWEIMFDAWHPDGVKRVRLVGIQAKMPFENWSESRDPQTGFFYRSRRYKSGVSRRYHIDIETEKGEVIRLEEVAILDRFASDPKNSKRGIIPQYQGFINLKDGDIVEANTPLYIGVDCMDPDGGFLVEDNVHVADDLNGVLSVTLKIDGTVLETKTNSTKEPVGVGSETAARSFGLYEFLNVQLAEGKHQLEIESKDRKGNIRTGPKITVTAKP